MRRKPLGVRLAAAFVLGLVPVAATIWFVPSLSAALLNTLFRLRGELTAPEDVVIVAIDDRSLQRVGRWPWPRAVMADVLDKITPDAPRVVGVDVIYSEPSDPENDRRLAAAIARNNRVVLPVHLYEAVAPQNSARPVTAWLPPPPNLAGAARALGHAHVSPGVDGMARSVQLSKADDRADVRWAFGLEVVRVAEGLAAEDWEEAPGQLRLGAHHISVHDETAGASVPGISVIRPNEMSINFAGPAGSFRRYSAADVLDGNVPPGTFAGKIVLVGAVAGALGDARAAPFMHYSAGRNQGGQDIPGVEIHANIVNTIRGSLSFTRLPSWADFAAALAVMLCSALIVHRLDGWRQIALLALLFVAITLGSFFAFSRHLIVPPLAPMVCGFVVVVPLLLSRALAASRELDLKLAALVDSQNNFLSADVRTNTQPARRPRGPELPRSMTWKLRAVDDLTTNLLSRMSFFNRVLSSMGEGVLVADLAGRVVFANCEASRLFDDAQTVLREANLADLLAARGVAGRQKIRELIKAVGSGGPQIQLEFEIPSIEPRHYSLLLSALIAGDEAGAAPALHKYAVLDLPAPHNAIGVVALISDVTKRVELDRMKTETLQLVSHELRAPLTSIQALSDVLIKFPVAAGDAREMLDTIHAEAVRLGETINRYLDLARLESRARALCSWRRLIAAR